MIKNLQELQSYTERLAEELPELKEEILLTFSGYSREQSLRLKESLPGIPGSYLDCLSKFKLKGISLSYFRLWPQWLNKTSDMIEEIIFANTTDKNPLLKLYRSKDLYEVASYEGDPICVSSENSAYEPGYVFWLNRSSGPEIKINKLCNSFEKFLIVAGNLDEVVNKYRDEDNLEGAKKEFSEVLKALQLLDDEETKAWKSIAEMSI